MTPLLAQTLHHIPLCGILLLFSTNGEEGGGVIPLVEDSTICLALPFPLYEEI